MSGSEIENVVFLGNTVISDKKEIDGVFTLTKAYLCAKVRPF